MAIELDGELLAIIAPTMQKPAVVEAFGEHANTSSIPEYRLRHVAASIEEEEDVAGTRVPT